MNEDLDMRAGSVGVIPSTMKVDRKLISRFSCEEFYSPSKGKAKIGESGHVEG